VSAGHGDGCGNARPGQSSGAKSAGTGRKKKKEKVRQAAGAKQSMRSDRLKCLGGLDDFNVPTISIDITNYFEYFHSKG
jgi:hypothetical protein